MDWQVIVLMMFGFALGAVSLWFWIRAGFAAEDEIDEEEHEAGMHEDRPDGDYR